jgi:hypothetical protein
MAKKSGNTFKARRAQKPKKPRSTAKKSQAWRGYTSGDRIPF